MSNNISTEEKIDYIYETLHKQESRRTWSIVGKWVFRLALLAYLYYFITFMLPLITDNIIDKVTPDIPNINTQDLNADALLNKAKDLLNY